MLVTRERYVITRSPLLGMTGGGGAPPPRVEPVISTVASVTSETEKSPRFHFRYFFYRIMPPRRYGEVSAHGSAQTEGAIILIFIPYCHPERQRRIQNVDILPTSIRYAPFGARYCRDSSRPRYAATKSPR